TFRWEGLCRRVQWKGKGAAEIGALVPERKQQPRTGSWCYVAICVSCEDLVVMISPGEEGTADGRRPNPACRPDGQLIDVMMLWVQYLPFPAQMNLMSGLGVRPLLNTSAWRSAFVAD